MTTIKLTLDEKSGKGKQIISFLMEMAQADDSIVIENFYEPNRKTIKAMNEAEMGLTTPLQSIDELFDSI